MKETALTLLKIAATLFPPLAALIGKALDNHSPRTSDEASLVSEVRAILPAESASRAAEKQIGG